MFASCDNNEAEVPDEPGVENPGDDGGETPEAGKVLVYEAEYDAAKDEWTMDGTQHVFGTEPVSTLVLVWNKYDNCYESYVKFETEDFDGEVSVDAPEWLEFSELAGEEGVIKLTATEMPLEGAEGTVTFTGDDQTVLGEVTVVAPALTAPFTVVFPTAMDETITTLHFDFNGKFNMGTEASPAWGDVVARGVLTAAVDGDKVPGVFVLSKDGDAISADEADWVTVEYAATEVETRSTLAEKRILVTVEPQEENAEAREAYIIFVPFDSEIKDAAELLSGPAIAGEYKNYPQFPVKQNAWREVPAFEFKDGYSDAFQSLTAYTPAWGWSCDNYFKLTYTEYQSVDDEGEIAFPTSVYLNFDFEKYEIYDSRGDEAEAYYTWTAGKTEGEFNWIQVRQAASSNPYMWQIAMTGPSTLERDQDDWNDPTEGYVVFYAKADDETPYAVLMCKYSGESQDANGGQGGSGGDEVTIVGEVDATVKAFEESDSPMLWKYFAEEIQGYGIPFYKVTFKGNPQDFKLSGLPVSTWEDESYCLGFWTTENPDNQIAKFYNEADEYEVDADGNVVFTVNKEYIEEMGLAGSGSTWYAVFQATDSTFTSPVYIIIEATFE